MKNLQIILLIRLMMLCGIILCGLTLIVPWGEFIVSANGVSAGGLQFYSWGLHIGSASFSNFDGIGTSNVWYSYMHPLFDSVAKQIMGENFLMHIFGLLFLPFSLVTFFYGISAYKSFEYYDELFRKKLRNSGMFAITSFIIFYIFIQFGMISNIPAISQYYHWSSGFIMMILVAILFIFLFFLTGEIDPFEESKDRPLVKEKSPEKSEKDAHEILKERYAKGEITQEDYEKMKEVLGK